MREGSGGPRAAVTPLLIITSRRVSLEADRPHSWHASLTLSAQRGSAQIISLQAIDSTLCLQVKHLHCRLIVFEVSYLAV